jgi:replicative DNA helicase
MTAELTQSDAPFGEQSAAESAAPPHNIEAEQAILGALFYDNDVYQRVGDFLKPDHFYDPLHARIFESASQLIIAGSLADAVVLRSRFERDPGMAEIGGPVYLADLMREAPDGASAVEYGKLIYDLALRRELIRFGQDVAHTAEDSVDDIPATSVLEEAERGLFALAETGGTQKSLRPFHEALEESMKMASAAYQRGGGLSGISTGPEKPGRQAGRAAPLRPDHSGRPPFHGQNLAGHQYRLRRRARLSGGRSLDGSRKTLDGGVVGLLLAGDVQRAARHPSDRGLLGHLQLSHPPGQDRRGAV